MSGFKEFPRRERRAQLLAGPEAQQMQKDLNYALVGLSWEIGLRLFGLTLLSLDEIITSLTEEMFLLNISRNFKSALHTYLQNLVKELAGSSGQVRCRQCWEAALTTSTPQAHCLKAHLLGWHGFWADSTLCWSPVTKGSVIKL